MGFVPDKEDVPEGRFIPDPPPDKSVSLLQALKPELPWGDAAAGALKGASNIGATLLRPFESGQANQERRQAVTGALSNVADPESLAFKGGELTSEVAATAGVGSALAQGVRAIPWLMRVAPKLATALQSGGFRLGAPATTTAGKVADVATRVGAGAAVGGASAGLVNPEEAGPGAAIGGVAPYAVQAAGAAGAALRPKVSDAVAALAKRAEELGIRIPADRIMNNRPMNAVAASQPRSSAGYS